MCNRTCRLQKSKEKEGEPELVNLFMKKLNQVLIQKFQVREFICLYQAIEDRLDPRSKWSKITVEAICVEFEVAPSTYYRKAKKLSEEGIMSIIPKKRGPKGPRLDGKLQDRIKELRELEISAKNISTMISVETQSHLSSSTTSYFLSRIGKSRLKRNQKKSKQNYIRFERSRPNELWQIDNVGPFYKPDKLFAYNVIDDHSRYNLATMISENQSSESWVDTLEILVQKYGIPDAILHDNGSQFVTTKYKNLTEKFKGFLKKYGIRSVRSRIRHPQTCGKVEKMQQSLQYEVRDLVFTNSKDQLQFAVDAWRSFYNDARVHSTTKMTPHQRYFRKKPSQNDMLTACRL